MTAQTIALCAIAGACLGACDDDDDEVVPPPPPQVTPQFDRSDLVSDLSGRAATQDPNLVNPWGLAFGPESFIWIANAGSKTLTVYSSDGRPAPADDPIIVTVPTGPGDVDVTGMVFNGTDEFLVSGPVPGAPAQMQEAPARFLAALTDGSIVGWSADVDFNNAITVVPPEEGEAYTGLTIATDQERGTLLYTANFPQKKVEVFDGDFEEVELGQTAFVDAGSPRIPDDYGPFNVQAIGDRIYVTYAQIDPDTGEETKGAGKGFVSIFDTRGTFIQRLVSNAQLDAPWGVARAPSNFGRLSNAILIGNFGNGWINAYNADTGAFIDAVRDESQNPIVIDGLWSLKFGNGGMAGATNDLLFTAGIDDETHGLFGRIRARSP